MALLTRHPLEKMTLDLNGPDGNAYVLLAYARRMGEEMNLTETTIQAILRTMKSGDYKNLVETFDANFGSAIDLVLPRNGL